MRWTANANATSRDIPKPTGVATLLSGPQQQSCFPPANLGAGHVTGTPAASAPGAGKPVLPAHAGRSAEVRVASRWSSFGHPIYLRRVARPRYGGAAPWPALAAQLASEELISNSVSTTRPFFSPGTSGFGWSAVNGCSYMHTLTPAPVLGADPDFIHYFSLQTCRSLTGQRNGSHRHSRSVGWMAFVSLAWEERGRQLWARCVLREVQAKLHAVRPERHEENADFDLKETSASSSWQITSGKKP